jgi:hypothetical protein
MKNRPSTSPFQQLYILSALESQNGVIERLQEQLADQQEKQNELQRQQIETEQLRHLAQQPQPNIEEHLGKLEGIVTSRVERMFTQHAQKESILKTNIVYNINRVLPLPQGNHVDKFGKNPIYRTKVIVWKPVWTLARHTQSHNTARLETGV